MVFAKDERDAVEKYRTVHPDIHEGTVNCAAWYRKDQWDEIQKNKRTAYSEPPAEVIRWEEEDMILVKCEEYYNDYYRKSMEKRFGDLKELEDWIFGQMKQDYSDKKTGWLAISFPVYDEPSTLEFKPERGGPHYWIHQISNENGIIFTDGRLTARQKHWSKEFREWALQCKERQYAPKFSFVE